MNRILLAIVLAIFAVASSHAGTIVRTNTSDGGAEFDHGSGIKEHATNKAQARKMQREYEQQGHKVVSPKPAPKDIGTSMIVTPANICQAAGESCTFSNDCCGRLFCRGEIGKRTCSNIGE